MKFFMWAAYNAYVLMDTKKPHSQCDKRVYKFHFFPEKLCVDLVDDVCNSTKREATQPAQQESVHVPFLSRETVCRVSLDVIPTDLIKKSVSVHLSYLLPVVNNSFREEHLD